MVAIVGMAEGSNRSRAAALQAIIGRDLFEAGLNEAAVGCAALWAFKASVSVFYDHGGLGDRPRSARRRSNCSGVIEDGRSAGAICAVARWLDIRAIGMQRQGL